MSTQLTCSTERGGPAARMPCVVFLRLAAVTNCVRLPAMLMGSCRTPAPAVPLVRTGVDDETVDDAVTRPRDEKI